VLDRNDFVSCPYASQGCAAAIGNMASASVVVLMMCDYILAAGVLLLLLSLQRLTLRAGWWLMMCSLSGMTSSWLT
jgi:hypothetical protein